MSEYQYYEFQAIDRPLTRGEMSELRGSSSRATITPTSFVNVYNWGDFRGSPSAWMEKYFDAFLYLANWGTHELMLRLPRQVLDRETAKLYCAGESASVRVKGDFVILEFHSEDESGDGDEDGEGWLSSLTPLRADIASGDLRALYLAWLLCAQEGELDEGETEPPCPPGLGRRSTPLDAFAEFLRIDPDLIDEAAAESPGACEAASDEALGRWISDLPDAEKTALLVRLARDGEQHVGAEFRRRFREARATPGREQRRKSRTVAELLVAARRRTEERRREEAERAEEERARRGRQDAAARESFLADLAKREPEAWRQVKILIATKRPGEYDQAVKLLKDLRDLGVRAGREADVEARIVEIREAHSRKPSSSSDFRRPALRGRSGAAGEERLKGDAADGRAWPR